jgi:hypothetical protein
MKLSDIIKEVETYFEINETDLARESINTGKYYGRVLRIRSEENIRLSQQKNELKRLVLEKRNYYGGKSEPDVYKEKPWNLRLTDKQVSEHVEVDSDVVSFIERIDLQTEKVAYINDALKMISQRQFQIKNAIEYQKLMAGGY